MFWKSKAFKSTASLFSNQHGVYYSINRGYASGLKPGGTNKIMKIKNSDAASSIQSANKPNRFAEKYEPKFKSNATSYSKKPTFPDALKRKSGVKFTEIKPQKTTDHVSRSIKYENSRKILREKEKEKQKEKGRANINLSKLRVSSGQKISKYTSNQKKAPQVKREKIKIAIPSFIAVSNLATIINVPLNILLKRIHELGFEDITHNYILDQENASLIADEFNFEISVDDQAGEDLFPLPESKDQSDMKSRPPVVTIMGHVDHGKTTILDFLRKSSIVDTEHGGITQHIGAFSVITPESKKRITFLDTPGHAAFLKMRERGAVITDIIILVVAADDSVMPQTIEAIKHAHKFKVPIIVAINKCDKAGVKVDKVLADLATHEVDIEDYGGETQTVRVSGKTGMNMDKLEEAVVALSELHDFRSEANIPCEAWVIESQQVQGLGGVATVLVKRGTLKTGATLVAGSTYCRVRGMKDENGKVIKTAGPSTPVQIWGWKDLPNAGDMVLQAKDEKQAKKVCENRLNREKLIKAYDDIEEINKKRQSEIKEVKRQELLNEFKLAGLPANNIEELEEKQTQQVVKYIIRSDVYGSAEAIKENIDGLGNEEVRSLVLSYDAGAPTDSDIETAKAVGAKIICFNLKTPKPIIAKAEKLSVDIKDYNVIYRLIEDVSDELASLLEPRVEIKILGEGEIKDTFTITQKNKSKVKIAGCKITTGSLKRASKVKVLRKGKEVFDGSLSSLKHIKDDISEAKKGTECGLSFNRWDSFESGDIIQNYEEILHKRFL